MTMQSPTTETAAEAAPTDDREATPPPEPQDTPPPQPVGPAAPEPVATMGQGPAIQPADASQIVSVDPSSAAWALALQPSSAAEAWAMAKHLFRSGLFGKKFTSIEAIWTVMLIGREHGLSALAALQSMHCIEGKVEMSAELIVAKILRSGLARYFSLVESTPEKATWKTHRIGEDEPLSMSFTIADAKKRGIYRAQWEKMPDVMCMWRAATKLARAKYPDVVRGLYGQGEIRETRAADLDMDELVEKAIADRDGRPTVANGKGPRPTGAAS